MINQPIFCLTSDMDWASDFCIEDLLGLLGEFNVVPTLFATHESPALTRFLEDRPTEVGLHPNFRNDSTHGTDIGSVIDGLFKIFPKAKTFRSHAFFDSYDILREMSRRGIQYDSNLCLYLQPDIAPLRLAVPGMTRFPVFWEDDAHWAQTGGDWRLDNYAESFLSPGLKIINVHPFLISANVPDGDYYARVKPHVTTLRPDDLASVRNEGPGPRAFLRDLLKLVTSQGHRFHTLDELHRFFALKPLSQEASDTAGRQTTSTDEEYRRYWSMSDEDKQSFVKASFEQRNPEDPYATSRDFHARELEIDAIRKSLERKGAILDLGCGNGYTLISLARHLDDWPMMGVDFSESLIEGAKSLMASGKDELRSRPEFLCADAVKHVDSLEEDSVSYVISERFIQNMPSVEWQKSVIGKIFRVLEKGGRLLMCEGSEEGFAGLNRLRETMGLSVIPDTNKENVSAIRLRDEEMEEFIRSEHSLKLVGKMGFSQYFIISRVLHPLMVSPLPPRFNARINHYARQIQENLDYTPGYGGNTLWVWEKY